MPKSTRQNLKDVDISQFNGRWVALEPTTYEVICAADTISAVKEEARKEGVDQPVMMEVPQNGFPFSGYTIADHPKRN